MLRSEDEIHTGMHFVSGQGEVFLQHRKDEVKV